MNKNSINVEYFGNRNVEISITLPDIESPKIIESSAVTNLLRSLFKSSENISSIDVYNMCIEIFNEGIKYGIDNAYKNLDVAMLTKDMKYPVLYDKDHKKYEVLSWMRYITNECPDITDIYTTLAQHEIIERNVGTGLFDGPSRVYQLDNGEYVQLVFVDELVQKFCNCKSPVPVFVHLGRNRDEIIKKLSVLQREVHERFLREHPVKQADPKAEHVYIVRCGETNLYKIGRTNNAEMRIASLQTCCPYELKMIRLYEVDDMGKCENDLHKRYEAYHERGEWFRLETNQINEIDQYIKEKWGRFQG